MSKKKEGKGESPVKAIDYLAKKLEILTKRFEYLNKLHDDNCNRGNKAFKEIEEKLSQCNYITQDIFLKNKVDLMMRLDKLEKANLCKKCEWIKKYDRLPTVVDAGAPQLHNENCDLRKFNPYCLTCESFKRMGIKACHQETLSTEWKDVTPKPKVGEIWKSYEGKFYLIKEVADSTHYYNGFVPCFKVCEVKYNIRLFKQDEMVMVDFTVVAQHHLKEKIC